MNQDIAQKCKQRFKKALDLPSCSICLEPLQKELGVFTECGHVFHYSCAITANQQSSKCPNCRQRSNHLVQLRFQIDEIDGVELQMQEVLNAMSQDEQFTIANLLGKYEDAVTALNKTKQCLTSAKEKLIVTEEQNKEFSDQCTLMKLKTTQLVERKAQLKSENETLKNANTTYKIQSESQYDEIKSLKIRMQELNYLSKIAQIIESQDEDGHVKYIKQHPSPQEQAKEFYNLYQIKNSRMKVLQTEMDKSQEELQQVKKKLLKEKQQYAELLKQNEQMKEHMKNRKQDRSQENSINQTNNYFDMKAKQIDHDIIMIAPEANKKRRPIIEVNKTSHMFGKNSLINQGQGIHNSLFNQAKPH